MNPDEVTTNGIMVEASDLVLGYERNIAVKHSSFTVPHQKVTAIIGPSGSPPKM